MVPSRWWYVAAGVVAALGVSLAAVLSVRGVLSYRDRIDAFQRIDVPGSGEVVLDEPGGYTVYFEPSAGVDVSPQVQVTIDGVELHDFGGSFSYSVGDRKGVALQTFRVAEPGRFRVRVSGETPGEVAVGRGVGGSVFRAVFLGLGIAGVSVLLAGAVAVFVAITRAGVARRFPPPPYAPPF